MKVTSYKIKLDIEKPMRIALVSDLHDRDPEDAIATLQQEKPDIILVAGDLMERHEPGFSSYDVESIDELQGLSLIRRKFHKLIKLLDGSLFPAAEHKVPWNMKNGYHFIEAAGKIAPIVIGMGNHEWYYMPEDLELMKENNAIALDNEDYEIQIHGEKLRIGALSTWYDVEWLESFGKKDGNKILICHQPSYCERFVDGQSYDTFDVIVSGHAHGGQWRLFSKGGTKPGQPVYSPGQGFLPGRAYGRFGRHIISGGVSNTSTIPRWGNPCEVVMLEASGKMQD